MSSRHSEELREQFAARPLDQRASLMSILSLFLLLLAFFLLLSTLSRFEVTRTRAVLGSLSATFRTSDSTGLERELNSLIGAVLGAERLEEAVTDILSTAVAFDEHELIRVGAELTATLSVAELFEEEGAKPRPGTLELAGLLADAMAKQPPGLRYEVDILLHPRGSDTALPIARADLLAEAFSEGGVVDGNLSVGLTRGDPTTAVLLFRVAPTDVNGVSFGSGVRPQ